LASAAVSAIADLVLTLTYNFPTFLIGNLLMGFGIGLYWPATEAVVADLTTYEQRNEAYALTRLGDSLGLGLGVVLGGALIALTGSYRALFIIDGISFMIFFGVVYWAIAETLKPHPSQHKMITGWTIALRDRTLLIYAAVNILFTTYLSQINSALPLYFTNFIPGQGDAKGFSSATISLLFSWHVVLAALVQLPIARALNRFSRSRALMISALFWGIGFVLIWFTGVAPAAQIAWAIAGLGVLAIATDAYTPAASSLVVALAPDALRGVYLSINSLCWAVGYFIGPTVGGWAMDQSRWIADGFWLVSAVSIVVAIAILHYLDRQIMKRSKEGGEIRS
jgi:MFS family permease